VPGPVVEHQVVAAGERPVLVDVDEKEGVQVAVVVDVDQDHAV